MYDGNDEDDDSMTTANIIVKMKLVMTMMMVMMVMMKKLMMMMMMMMMMTTTSRLSLLLVVVLVIMNSECRSVLWFWSLGLTVSGLFFAVSCQSCWAERSSRKYQPLLIRLHCQARANRASEGARNRVTP